MKITVFRCYGLHMAQSTINVEHTWHVAAEIKCQKYTWFGATEIKILCKEGTVYPSRWIHMDIHMPGRPGRPGRPAQSIIDVGYTWLSAAKFKSARKAYSIFLTLNIYGSVHHKSNPRSAQSITDVEYTWLGAVEIKCREGTVYHLRWIYMARCAAPSSLTMERNYRSPSWKEIFQDKKKITLFPPLSLSMNKNFLIALFLLILLSSLPATDTQLFSHSSTSEIYMQEKKGLT